MNFKYKYSLLHRHTVGSCGGLCRPHFSEFCGTALENMGHINKNLKSGNQILNFFHIHRMLNNKNGTPIHRNINSKRGELSIKC